jgi:hypothetical protein
MLNQLQLVAVAMRAPLQVLHDHVTSDGSTLIYSILCKHTGMKAAGLIVWARARLPALVTCDVILLQLMLSHIEHACRGS